MEISRHVASVGFEGLSFPKKQSNSEMKPEDLDISKTLASQDVATALPSLEVELLKRRTLDLSGLSAEAQHELLTARALNVIPPDRLLTLLRQSKESGIPISVKFGVDPTGADLHIGHACPMVVLNRLQRMGHDITLVIGDFTAKIGDPSGRSSQRPKLTDEQIRENFKTYTEQVAPFFDFSKAKVFQNGSWLNQITLPNFVETLSKVGVSEVLQREDFRTRLNNGDPLSMAEIVYSVVMALDSVHLKSDLELGGVDQLLNMQMCRRVMELKGQQAETLITTDLLPGTTGDGRKMSKSFGNYVGLRHEPSEVYGRVMSIPDSLIGTYFRALTEVSNSEWDVISSRMEKGEFHPMAVKKSLAKILTATLYDISTAEKAAQGFDSKFSKRELSTAEAAFQASGRADEMLLDVLATAKIIASKGEGRRLMQGGGLKLVVDNDTQAIRDPNVSLGSISNGKENLRIMLGKLKIVDIAIQLS